MIFGAEYLFTLWHTLGLSGVKVRRTYGWPASSLEARKHSSKKAFNHSIIGLIITGNPGPLIMPIQRTLSPVPPLGKKTHHMVLSKKDFNDLEIERSPLLSLSTPNGLTSAIVTPSSLSADMDHSMNGLMHNFSSLVFAEDTDDESVTEQGKATDHKVLYDSGKLEPEPLLVANPRRFVLFPIQDNEVWLIFW